MRFHTRHIKGLLAAGIVSLVSTGCLLGASDSQGPSLLRTGPEPAGERCEYGGVRVESGRDLDGNGMLDNDEVERASFACNARVDGFDSRTRIDQGAPDDVCPDGGVTVLVGLDADDDGRLVAHKVALLPPLRRVGAGRAAQHDGDVGGLLVRVGRADELAVGRPAQPAEERLLRRSQEWLLDAACARRI